MTFKAGFWYPVALGLTALNLAGLGFAVAAGESWHAATHGVLALVFGLWARRLQHGPGTSELQAGLEALELEVSRIREELTETQERLDFAERMLAQAQETRRVGPEHSGPEPTSYP